jgi:hypothetical protein
MHRLFKFLQLGAFTYIGVFAELFDPTSIIIPSDLSTPAEVGTRMVALSWQGACVAYAVSRLLLGVQYVYGPFKFIASVVPS